MVVHVHGCVVCARRLSCTPCHDLMLGACAGWMLMAPIVAMSALGIPWLSRHCYAAFFKVHVIMAAATLVGVVFHGFGAAVSAGVMPLAIPGGLLWLLDLALRAAFGTRASSCSLLPPWTHTFPQDPVRL